MKNNLKNIDIDRLNRSLQNMIDGHFMVMKAVNDIKNSILEASEQESDAKK